MFTDILHPQSAVKRLIRVYLFILKLSVFLFFLVRVVGLFIDEIHGIGSVASRLIRCDE
jgi:hypothetical protein